MIEAPFLCTACAAEYRSPAELLEHVEARHAPSALEPDLELARRLGREALEPEDLVVDRKAAALDPDVPVTRVDAVLRVLRADAARAIAERDRERLLELSAELKAIATLSDELAVSMARMEKEARETRATVERVIDMLEELDP